jgi:hypothetical protein
MNVHLALALVVAVPAAAFAQPEATRDEAPKPQVVDPHSAPEMAGHMFMPSLLVDTPFRETTFKLGILYGFGKATGPKYDAGGNVVGQNDYTFGAFAQVFRYEYQFTEWLSAGLAFLTSVYSGIDGPSAVSIGADIGVGFGASIKAGHRFGPVQTAIVVDVSTQPQFGILVAEPILKAIQDHVIDAGSALQTTHSFTVMPRLAASWAPWPALGLTANAGYVYNSLRLSGTNIGDQSGVLLAAVADFDFGKISAVDLGINAGYRLTTPLGSNGITRVDDISGGLFYTARRDLGVGLEIGWRAFTIRPPLDSKGLLVQIELQYYW